MLHKYEEKGYRSLLAGWEREGGERMAEEVVRGLAGVTDEHMRGLRRIYRDTVAVVQPGYFGKLEKYMGY